MDASAESHIAGLPPVGSVIGEKYRVDSLLGVGGMGAVVAATHLHLEQRVAIKFLIGDARGDSELAARFSREAWAASKIDNDHIARVIDVGSMPDASPYMVMEHLQGHDLEAVVENGALPLDTAVAYVLQAGEALAEAHRRGIIHRDLKPSNLFLTHRSDGSPFIKVLDFGVSKILTDTAAKLTKTSHMMGSPLYMSPEQMNKSSNVDARSDIWGLATILFELLTQHAPFSGESLPQLCAEIMFGKHLRLRASRPDVPPAFEAVIDRCLAKEPKDRYRDMTELATALAPFGGEAVKGSVAFIHRVSNNPLVGEARTSIPLLSATATPLPVGSPPGPAMHSGEAAARTLASGHTPSATHSLHGAVKIGSSTTAPTSSTPIRSSHESRRWKTQVAFGLMVGLALGMIGFVLLAPWEDSSETASPATDPIHQPPTAEGTNVNSAGDRAPPTPTVQPEMDATPVSPSTPPTSSASAAPTAMTNTPEPQPGGATPVVKTAPVPRPPPYKPPPVSPPPTNKPNNDNIFNDR